MIRKHARRALRLDRHPCHSAGGWCPHAGGPPATNAVVDCGWGSSDRGAHLSDPAQIAAELLQERAGAGHCLLSGQAPCGGGPGATAALCGPIRGVPADAQQLPACACGAPGFTVRRLRTALTWRPSMPSTAAGAWCPWTPSVSGTCARRPQKSLYVLAEDRATGEVIGVAMGAGPRRGLR